VYYNIVVVIITFANYEYQINNSEVNAHIATAVDYGFTIFIKMC